MFWLRVRLRGRRVLRPSVCSAPPSAGSPGPRGTRVRHGSRSCQDLCWGTVRKRAHRGCGWLRTQRAASPMPCSGEGGDGVRTGWGQCGWGGNRLGTGWEGLCLHCGQVSQETWDPPAPMATMACESWPWSCRGPGGDNDLTGHPSTKHRLEPQGRWKTRRRNQSGAKSGPRHHYAPNRANFLSATPAVCPVVKPE